jgi:ATP-dependent RNA helicase SUPV3L1/SUV3
LQAWLDDEIRADMAPLFAAEAMAAANPALRGPLHRLMESLGLIPGADAETLDPAIRPQLRALGVRSGRFALFMPALMKPRAAAMRARLWALHRGVAVPDLPHAGLVSIPAEQPAWPPGFAAASGWVDAGPIMVRLDVAEKVAADLGYRSRRAPMALPPGLASRLAIRAELLPAVLRHLGFRVLPAAGPGPEQQGPPSPNMLTPLRRRHPVAVKPAVPARAASGPFAALAVLRR